MHPLPLRPRTATEIVDTAFQLSRAHYPAMVGAMLLVLLPAIALQILLPGDLDFIGGSLSQLLYLPGGAAVTLLVAAAYCGETVAIRPAVSTALSRIFSLIGAGIVQGVLIGVGLLLLVVPGFIFFAWTFAMPIVVVLEGCGIGPAFERSRELARGQIKQILLTLGVAYLIFFFAIFGMGMVLGFAVELGAFAPWLGELGGELLGIVLYPFVSAVATLLYFDLRIRNEAFDVETLTERLDTAVTSEGR